MARKTRPTTYQTSPAFFGAVPQDLHYDLVLGTVGNEVAQLGGEDEFGGFVVLARVDYEGVEYTLVIAWAADHSGYEIVAEPFTLEAK